MTVAPVAATSTRDRLIGACETCLWRDGLRRTTMVDVAREAGVSRAALYKHFPDKATLVLAAIAVSLHVLLRDRLPYWARQLTWIVALSQALALLFPFVVIGGLIAIGLVLAKFVTPPPAKPAA